MYVPSDYPFPSVVERYQSFHQEARALGLTVIDSGAVSGHLDSEVLPPQIHLRLDEADLAHLGGSDRVTAIQCWDDNPAYRIASQLADLGFRIPADVAVVGYNGCSQGAELRWNLTTIRASWPAVGAAAIDVLHALIEGRDIPSETVMPVHLSIGATT
jgi:DNA-binding LacI/PurR family transcriptional regulator